MQNIKKSFLNDISAVLSVFFAISYVLVIVPKLLETAGMNYYAAFLAVGITSALGCFLCAFFIKKPLVFAPYISENSFLALSATALMGFSFQEALSGAFLAAILVLVVFILNYKFNLLVQTPSVIRAVLPCAIGLFLVLVGLFQTGILIHSTKPFSLNFGNLLSPEISVVFLALTLLFILKFFKIRLNVLIAIISAIVLAYVLGLVEPFSYSLPVFKFSFFKPDVSQLLNLKYIPLVVTFFVFLLNDISVSSISVLSYDSDARVNDEKNAMFISAVSSILAPLFGCVSTGVYPESILALEHKASGRVFSFLLGAMFLLSLPLMPFLNVIPVYICASVLIYIGALLCSQANFRAIKDFADFLSVLLLLILTCVTMNLAIGICAALISYTLLKLVTAKYKQLNILTVLLALLSVVFFVFYPR